MTSKHTSFRTLLTAGALLLVAIAVFLNRTFANVGLARFDLTEEKIYTVSDGAKNIMAKLTVPVQVKYYVTPEDELPAGIKTLPRDVTDKLSELSIASKGMLEYAVVDPKETPELEETLFGKGVRPFQVQSVERDAMAVKLVYSAVSIGYKDAAEEILPQILPDNLGTFEYELLSRILKLTRESDPVLAVYSTTEPIDPQLASFYLQSGQPLPQPADNFAPVPEFFRGEGYDVRSIELNEDSGIPDEARTLLLLAPRELNDRQRWEIHQVLRRGGSVIVAAQASVYDYQAGPRGGYAISVKPQTLGINDLLNEYGLRIDDRLLMDAQMATLAIPREQNIGGLRFQVSEPVQAPMQIRVLGESLDRDLPFTAGVPELLYLWGNQVVVDEQGILTKNLTAKTLFHGSDTTWLVDKKAGPLQMADLQVEGHPVQARPSLAVLVEGVFPDPWADKPAPPWPASVTDATAAPPEAPEAGPPPPPEPGRLLVVGCSKMFEEMLLNQAGHGLFLLNSVDAMTLGDDLISIRSKQFDSRTFEQASDGKKLAFRVVNIALVPLVVVGFGLGNRMRRRRQSRDYAAKLGRPGGSSR
ncbi:MAG: Gldg family protein [bacterium]